MKRYYILIILLSIFYLNYSQKLDNLRIKQFNTILDTIQLDSLSYIPGSIIIYDINGNILPDSLYKENFSESKIILPPAIYKNYNYLKISYRVFPYNFSKEYYHKEYESTILGPEFKKPIPYIDNKQFDPFAGEKLGRSGNISRGISFGNNQDVIVNSNLNLQLSGKLSNNLNIKAAITDDNIPIQPDGYSQQIQEFDKIFINIYNENVDITAGDFDLIHNEGYFLKANKKGQGGMATIYTKGNKFEYITSISGAVAKGRFTRNKINVLEGNQGPYKLYGENNELYIIILAGSEKVYIDGKLLTRGESNDYVMNYNSSEITFTSKQPITKDKRVVIEFEYSDRNYSRFMIYDRNIIKTKKGQFWFNIYNEQDGKNQPLQQDLTGDDKRILKQIGDDFSRAIVPNIDNVGYSSDAVRYKKIYSTEYNDTIYIYSTNPDSAIYKVGFSYVGENKGNYIQSQNNVNGKVFEWIAPINGILQGTHSPVTLLITPKKQQLISMGFDMAISPGLKTYFEAGISNNDLNTFSTKNSDDNVGIALKTGIDKNIMMRDSGKTGLITSLRYEFKGENFIPIERYRTVEFERDWNIENNNLKINEHILNISTRYIKNNAGKAQHSFDYLSRGNLYNGYKNHLNLNLASNGYKAIALASLLNSYSDIANTDFLRYTINLSKTISNFTIGIINDYESNKWRNAQNKSLLANSFLFNQYGVYAIIGDSLKNNFFVNYLSRIDKLPENDQLTGSTKSKDLNISFQYINKNTLFKSGITYRNLTLLDTSLTYENATETVTGRIENNSTILKKIIRSISFYEVGTGLEPVKEFSYIKVPQGQGIYTWNDYNNNEVQELDEFEIANFKDEANYLRIFSPTNNYEKVFINKFSQSFHIDPYRQWHNKQGILKALSRISNQFTYRVSQKNRNIRLTDNFNPFFYITKTENLQDLNTSIREIVSFNKQNTVFAADFVYTNSHNKILLANGIDTRKKNEKRVQVRYKLLQKINVNGYISWGSKIYDSKFFISKNYSIDNYNRNIELRYQPISKVNIKINYLNNDKINTLGEEKLVGNNFGMETRFVLPLNGSTIAKFNYINFNYNGSANSPLAYEMLEGLKPGDNYTWNINLFKELSNGLELNLNYEGRGAKKSKTIHIGGIQLRANF